MTDWNQSLGRRAMSYEHTLDDHCPVCFGICSGAGLTVFAAVEDWARWEHVPKGTLRRLEQAEAVITRVRDVCDQADEDGTALVWLADVRRALDGSGDVLVRDAVTAMLSNDAPLIDPDCRDGKHASCVGGPCECSCHELAMRG